jgi:hypothetical protein
MRSKLTYANVMATLAVFIALGGASYAALRLPKNSVGARQIKKGAVNRAELARNAVNGSKIQNGSVTEADLSFKPATSPVASPAPASVSGAEFVVGYEEEVLVPVEPGEIATVETTCPGGETALGGGGGFATNSEEAAKKNTIVYSRLSPSDKSTWEVRGANNSASVVAINAQAVCLAR